MGTPLEILKILTEEKDYRMCFECALYVILKTTKFVLGIFGFTVICEQTIFGS